MSLPTSSRSVAWGADPRPFSAEPPSLTLAAYLVAVAGAIRAGLPERSWIEATIAAAKPSSFGTTLQLVDPAGGASAPSMRAFLRTADRDAIARRLGASFDPAHLVGLTAVLLVEPEFHPRWGMGGRVVGLAADLRESLMRRALDDIRTRLKVERLYDRQRRRSVPADVVRVGVVHPAGAAGHADLAGELARWERAGIITVTSVATPFEGSRAVAGIVAALRRASSENYAGAPDVILMVRGGGDRTGLLALDDEAVARAICLCPVPVVTGLGHATDRSLADEVAYLAADTPSKAMARLAALIAAPARRARADMATVLTEADRRATVAEHGLDATRHAALSAAERRLAAQAAALATAHTGVEAGIAGALERCARLEAEATRLYDTVVDRAPHRIDDAGRTVDRLAAEMMQAGRRRLERADDGCALIGAVLTRAAARCDAAALDIDRRIEAVPIDAARRLTDAALDIGRLAETFEARGLDATLARGFALATTPDGILVPTRAAALAAAHLLLTFVDGTVAARVDASPTATPTLFGDAP